MFIKLTEMYFQNGEFKEVEIVVPVDLITMIRRSDTVKGQSYIYILKDRMSNVYTIYTVKESPSEILAMMEKKG